MEPQLNDFMSIQESSSKKGGESNKNSPKAAPFFEGKTIEKYDSREIQSQIGSNFSSGIDDNSDEEPYTKSSKVKKKTPNFQYAGVNQYFLFFSNIPISLKRQTLLNLFHSLIDGLIDIVYTQQGQGKFFMENIESLSKLYKRNGFLIRGMKMRLKIPNQYVGHPHLYSMETRTDDLEEPEQFCHYKINYQIFKSKRNIEKWMKEKKVNVYDYRNLTIKKQINAPKKAFIEIKKSTVERLKGRKYQGSEVIFTPV